jgi:hypothetical protein
MQNSELFRRGVVVPLDDEALGRIRANDVAGDTRVEYAEIANESDFEWLWARDFFARINAETGSTLDDHEEDELDPSTAGAVALLALEFEKQRHAPASIQQFCRKLGDACSVATATGYPMFFVL